MNTPTFKQERLMQVLLAPVVSEKSTFVADKNEQVIFKVAPNATKPEIKAAIEMLFEVKVIGINTLTKPPKKRRVGRFVGFKPRYKRAIVRLAADDQIVLFPEV